MAITAVIPARGGSTRLLDKNVRKFANSSLLEVKIEQLKRVKIIDEIMVSSDSESILEIARKSGVTAVRRPDEYCDEKTKSFNEVVNYIATEEVKTENMLWAPCVCPLLKDESLKRGVGIFNEILKKKINADSVVSAQLIKEYIYSENGPVNYSLEHFVPTQHLPNWHIIQNGFFIATTENMARWSFVYGFKPYLVEISKLEAIDIDDITEFKMAEYFFTCPYDDKEGRSIYE